MQGSSWITCAGLSALVVVITAAPARAQLIDTRPLARCEVVDLTAEAMTCERDHCELSGEVVLRCADLRLWADRVRVDFDAKGELEGALAEGNVILLQGRTVLTCTRMTLGPDQVSGRIEQAAVRVKRVRPPADEPLAGRNEAVFRGDIVRHDAERYEVFDGELTLCDCGDAPPSWRLTASRIEARIDERATLYWPVFRPRLFGVLDVPLPLLAPISVPLERRAWGLLPPRIQFFGNEPTIDLPLFVPLGSSWDLTVAPGLRTDWAPAFDALEPSTWGAPRLGGRLRYFPTSALEGSLEAQWTHDPRHWSAKRRQLEATPDLEPRDVVFNEQTPDWSLVDRIAVAWKQRAQLAAEMEWLLDAEWLSDDLYLRDFRASLREQAASYIPSRTQALWHGAPLSAIAAADYLLLLGNDPSDPSNVRGAEAGTLHRGPFLRAHLSPVRVAEGLHLDGDASYVRYGPWTGADTSSVAPGQQLAASTFGVSYLERLGAVSLATRAALDGLWSDLAPGATTRELAVFTRADADVRLAASFGAWLHELTPRLSYRALPWDAGELPSTTRYDERLQRRRFHQIAAELSQVLWRRTGAAHRQLLELDLSQPWDLEEAELLQTQAELRWRLAPWTGGLLRASLAPGASEAVRELTAASNLQVGPVRLDGRYVRWLPDADRLRRTRYELAAAPRTVGDPERWVHFVTGLLRYDWRRILGLSYGTDLLLPTPEEDRLRREADPSAGRRVELTEHRIALAYTSPCDCWGFNLTTVFPRERPIEDLRLNFILTIGGYSLAGPQ